MTTNLSVIIPCAPHHLPLVERARVSCDLQTIPVRVIVVVDHEKRGAGWARNRGIEQAGTPFVTFLDADDVLEPTFAEDMLAAWDGKHYLYCSWWQDSEVVTAPACAWVNRTWHGVTSVVPTVWAREIGGFDESLPAAEDTDFYLRLCMAGYCGKRVNKPLFHYTKDGERSRQFVGSALYEPTMTRIHAKHEGKRMACCGENADYVGAPIGSKADGDVLAMALWAGNRQERGRVTGRIYARGSYPARMWVDSRDIDAMPHLWTRVSDTPAPLPPAPDPAPIADSATVDAAAFMMEAVKLPGGAKANTFIPRGDVKPDVTRLLELWRND